MSITLGSIAAAAIPSLINWGANAVTNWLFGKSSSGSSSGSSSSSSYNTGSISSAAGQQGSSASTTTTTGSTSSLGNLYSTAVSTPTSVDNNSLYNSLSNLMNNAFNAVGTIAQWGAQQSAANSAMTYNSQEAAIQRAWEEQMSNTSYQRGVKDLQAAGLNPVLAAYNGYGASTPSGSAASTSIPRMDSINSAGMSQLNATYQYANNTADMIDRFAQAINSAEQVSKTTSNYQISEWAQKQFEEYATTVGETTSAFKEYQSNELRNLPQKEKAFSTGGGKSTGGGGGRAR